MIQEHAKIRAGSDLQHNIQQIYYIYRQIPQQTCLCSGSPQQYYLPTSTSVSCQSVLESLIVLLDDDLVTAAFVS